MESERARTPEEHIEEVEVLEEVNSSGVPIKQHFNRHHILFYRREWARSNASRNLRGLKALIPHIDDSVHNELHDFFREKDLHVPILGAQTIQIVSELYDATGDPLENIDRLLSSIEKATHSPANTNKELAERAIYAIELQIPFIKEGLIR